MKRKPLSPAALDALARCDLDPRKSPGSLASSLSRQGLIEVSGGRYDRRYDVTSKGRAVLATAKEERDAYLRACPDVAVPRIVVEQIIGWCVRQHWNPPWVDALRAARDKEGR